MICRTGTVTPFPQVIVAMESSLQKSRKRQATAVPLSVGTVKRRRSRSVASSNCALLALIEKPSHVYPDASMVASTPTLREEQQERHEEEEAQEEEEEEVQELELELEQNRQATDGAGDGPQLRAAGFMVRVRIWLWPGSSSTAPGEVKDGTQGGAHPKQSPEPLQPMMLLRCHGGDQVLRLQRQVATVQATLHANAAQTQATMMALTHEHVKPDMAELSAKVDDVQGQLRSINTVLALIHEAAAEARTHS
tara:strand:- start:2511 stop:3263 length:753 start_codon:yes stop_codon:yes gene_type:complete